MGVVQALAGSGESCGLPNLVYKGCAVSDRLDGQSVGGFRFEVQRVDDDARTQKVQVEIFLRGTPVRGSYGHGY